MSNKRVLKKFVSSRVEDVIQACIDFQEEQPKEADKAEKIIDESIDVFDNIIVQISARNIEHPKTYFKEIKNSFEAKVSELLDKVSKL